MGVVIESRRGENSLIGELYPRLSLLVCSI